MKNEKIQPVGDGLAGPRTLVPPLPTNPYKASSQTTDSNCQAV